MPVNFTGSYTQNFNSLANSGSDTWTNEVTLPGWSLFRQPTPVTAIGIYSADNGAGITGSFFSYGTTPADRALGGLGASNPYFGSPVSGAVAGWIAFAATNTTGATLNTVNLAFNGEQWRNGGNTTAQSMILQYGFGATFAAVTTWNAPGGTFDWASPVTTATAAPVDGNVAGLVANRGGTLNSLNWTNNSTLWLRWVENNDANNDHGLAIDNFSLSVPVPTVNLSVNSTAGTEVGTTIITVTATASSAVVGAQTLNLGVSGTGITTGDYTLSSPTITILAGQTIGTATFTIVDDVLIEGSETATLTLSNPSAGIVLGTTTTQAITITDNDNPPTDLILSATIVNENVAPNTFIGTFTTLDPDGGNFTYSLVPGTGSINNSAFTIVGNQLQINASPDFETQPSYSVRVRTTDFSGLTYDKQISIIVNNLNDAPILSDTVVTLNSVRFNAPPPLGAVGTSIFQLANLTGGSGQNNVIDPDAGALTGIAITNVDSLNGSWFYSTNNGTNWTTLGPVSNTNALLLADTANTRLYFRPNTGYTDTLANAITYRAWDQTSGTNGTTADTTTNGNPTAFSVQFDTASLQVNRTDTTDFTKDGITDILWRNSINGQNIVWAMDGTTRTNSTFLPEVAVNSGWNAVATGDFTKDGKTDILWRNNVNGQNIVWAMDGTTRTNSTFLPEVAVNSGWDIVGAGDFTKDGKTDILWRNSVNGQNLVWAMDGTTRTSSTFLPEVPNSSGWKVAGVGDFTKDGNADILWHNSLDGSIGVWGMDGTTRNNFLSVGTVSPSSGWNIV